nr:hypothetical protein [Tanacetum cinerariifolium]
MAGEKINNLTMEQYLTLTQGNQTPGVTCDAVILCFFPITLIGAVKIWVNRLTPGTINTWDLLKKAFIQRYCPPSKTTKQLEDIATSCKKKKRHCTKLGKGVEEVKYGKVRSSPFIGMKYHVAATEIPTSSVGQCKAVYDDAPINKASSNKTNEIHGVSFIDEKEDDNLPSKDLGASINVMPKSVFEHLKLANLKETNMLVEMADMAKKVPLGIIENTLVKIDKFLFSSNFVIIDMLSNETMILGRPFLATIHAEIEVFNKEISIRIRDDKIIFDMNKKGYKFTTPIEKAYMVNAVHGKDLIDIDCDLFLYESESCEFNRLLTIDPDIFTYDIDIQESYKEIIYSEEDDDTNDGWEDLKKCREEKIDVILDIVFDKPDDSWFSGETQDEDDLDGITDYLELTSYDGFIDSEDEAYKERLCKFLGIIIGNHPQF